MKTAMFVPVFIFAMAIGLFAAVTAPEPTSWSTSEAASIVSTPDGEPVPARIFSAGPEIRSSSLAPAHADGTFHIQRTTVFNSKGYIVGWNVYLWTPSGAKIFQYFSPA